MPLVMRLSSMAIALFHAEPAEDLDRPLAGEHLHQVVFEADVEARRAGVALPPAAAAELVVDAAGGVALGADHVQPAGLVRSRAPA